MFCDMCPLQASYPLNILKRKRNATIYILVFHHYITNVRISFKVFFYVPTQLVMICHKLYLIACFHSDVNVTFVLFDNLRLKYGCLFRLKNKQNQSIAWCLYKQKTTKMFGNYCLAALFFYAFLF